MDTPNMEGANVDKYVVVRDNQVGNGMTYMMEKGPAAQGQYNDVVRPEVQASENSQTKYTDYGYAENCEGGVGDE